MSWPRYGLIGERLGHSHSPAIHSMLVDYAYELFPISPGAVASFIRQPNIGGLNVTIPYKETVLPLCDALSPQAMQIGSVNTLVYDEAHRITGHNTDYAGVCAMLKRAGIGLKGQKVLVLGTGGTCKTVLQVARDAGAREIITVSRSGPVTYENVHQHTDADILINTTPVGMFPNVEASPVSLALFPALRGVVDVIYNPLRTRLLLEAMDRGIPTAGGLSMLVYQAAEAASLFTGAAIAPERTEAVLRRMEQNLENIILIGMPGCGKSRIGRTLAKLSGRRLVDTDREVVRRAGKPIPEIFAEDGEAAFRALESNALREAAKKGGLVIATGGGSILSAENRLALRQNGHIVQIRRPLDLLTTKGRPLSVDLDALAAQRQPLYDALCDFTVDNAHDPQLTTRKIWKEFNR